MVRVKLSEFHQADGGEVGEKQSQGYRKFVAPCKDLDLLRKIQGVSSPFDDEEDEHKEEHIDNHKEEDGDIQNATPSVGLADYFSDFCDELTQVNKAHFLIKKTLFT